MWLKVLILFFLLTSSAYADIITGLVGWWKMDETSGTTVSDSSGNGLHGTFVGTPIRVPGPSGSALKFNGNDFIRLPQSPRTALGVKTTAVWIKQRDFVRSSETLFGFAGVPSWTEGIHCADSSRAPYTWNSAGSFGALKASYEDASLVLQRPGSIIAPYNTIQLGKWDHYVTTFAADGLNITITVYKNGVAIGAPYTAANGFSSNRCFMHAIGTQEDITNLGYLRIFTGEMDDARLYNRALSAADVAELYNSMAPTTSDRIAPTNPLNLTAKKDATASASRINLSWSASSDAVGVTGYIIYRSTSEGGTYLPLATTEGTTYSDMAHAPASTYIFTLTPGSKYYYKVAAYDAAYSISAQSSSANVTLDSAPSGTFNLTVNRVGTGMSDVTSFPKGINCTGTCTSQTYAFPKESTVHIKPQSKLYAPFAPFTGWHGAGCTNAAICVIHMDSDKTVTAYYTVPPPSTNRDNRKDAQPLKKAGLRQVGIE